MKIGITGVKGFIGNQLAVRLSELGHDVYPIVGDIRDSETFRAIDYTYDYVYHFAAPSSQVQFKRASQFCIDSTFKGFMNVADACDFNGVRLVYPSTGILSHGQTNEYARCKAICEDYAPTNSIGLRIFATYGPQEAHKGDYASVPYLFAKDIVQGRQPLIFGSGEQVRDFIFIDDTVNSIITLAEQCREKIVDIGSGTSLSFNNMLEMIYEITGKENNAIYIERPDNYVDETHADTTLLNKFYVPKTELKTGLTKIIESISH